MNILSIILSGIAGTALMTAFMYGLSIGTGRRLKVVKILGTMLTFQTTPGGRPSNHNSAILIGILAHYAVGIVFTAVYAALWHLGIGKPDLLNGIILGTISGILAMGIWRVFIRLHPAPPDLPIRSYLFSLFLAHIIFAVSVAWVYRMLTA